MSATFSDSNSPNHLLVVASHIYLTRMSDEPTEADQIQPPKDHRGADVTRALVKGGLGAIPLAGSLLAEAADLAMPNPTEADRRRWEGDVTDGVTSLHGRVDQLDQRTGPRKITLEGGAAIAAKYLAENCPDGMAHQYHSAADIHAAYPDMPLAEIKDGLADLESYGLIEACRAINRAPDYRLTGLGYETLDPPVMGWSPVEDARQIAALVGEKQGGSSAAELEAALGWPRRRFNPAFRVVVDQIGTGRVSGAIQPNYVTMWVSPNDAERASLRRFAKGG